MFLFWNRLGHDIALTLVYYLLKVYTRNIVTHFFFIKMLLKICNANCSWVVCSFPMPSKFSGASTVLNQMRFVKTFVFVKLFSTSETLSRRFSKKISVLVLLQKIKDFRHNFLLSASTKKIKTLEIKIVWSKSWIRFSLSILFSIG